MGTKNIYFSNRNNFFLGGVGDWGTGKKTRAVGGQRARLLGTFYIVTFLSLSHIK